MTRQASNRAQNDDEYGSEEPGAPTARGLFVGGSRDGSWGID